MDVIQHKLLMPMVFVKPVTFMLPKVHTFFFVIYEYFLFLFGSILALQLQGLSRCAF